MTTFELLQVEKSFGTKHILKDIHFECRKGEILAVFGHNGCGKSTLLKIIFGTLPYDRFEALLDGTQYDPSQNIRNQQIAYLPQHNMLPRNKRVRDIVTMFHPNPEAQDHILYNPKIASIDRMRFGELSGGEKKFFEIMLISQLPHGIMIFDEPFSMIDPIEQEQISELLQRVKRDKIIIITDHYYRNVLNISSSNVLIDNGVSKQINSVDELIQGNYLKERF